MKLLLKILGSVFSAAVTVVLLWGLLYLCITPVRDWTDTNIFKTQQEEVQEDTENTETNMFVNFDTHTITLEV